MVKGAALSKADLIDLPDEVAAEIAPHIGLPSTTLAAISAVISAKRIEAVAARKASGIEAVWLAAEEAYIGIDEANRAEYQNAKWAKPMSIDGPLTSDPAFRNVEVRSTAFIRLTARYVDAGAAKLQEILLPPDDKAFNFKELPDPDLDEAKDDKSQVMHDGMGNTPLWRPARPGETPHPFTAAPQPQSGPSAPQTVPPAGLPGAPTTAAAPAGSTAVLPAGAGVPPPANANAPMPPGPGMVPLTVADLAEEKIEMARKTAKLAETRVYSWFVECQYNAEMRKVIFDSSRIGVGVIKGPFPKIKRTIKASASGENVLKITTEEKIAPACKWVDPWKLFPDPACGENIHNGDYLFEQDYMSERQVRELARIPGYIKDQIDAAIEVGPTTDIVHSENPSDDENGTDGKPTKRFDVWYYYGALKREEMDVMFSAAGKVLDVPEDQESIFAIVTMIGDIAVRASFNPLDSGHFPYRTMPWQRRAGHWAGIGVGEQCKMPQRTLNASVRSMLNNAGISAGAQIIIDHATIVPANGDWAITPNKIWYRVGGGDVDVTKSMTSVEIQNVTESLMTIVKFAMQLAEESTSIPLITQGQSGPTTPETFGATALQDNNANQLLRSIGYTFDDNITEPLVRDFYEWLLLDPDVPESEKGNFQIDAHGSIALVERAIQDQTIEKMMPMAANALNPYGMDPKRVLKMWCKSKRMDPADFQYSQEEQKRIDSSPPPDAPVVAAAKVNQDTQLKLGVMKQQVGAQSIQSEERIEAAANVLEGQHVQNDQTRIAAEERRTAAEQTVRLHEIAMKRDVAIMEYANRRHISLDQARTELAKTSMSLQVERDINAQNNAHDMAKHMSAQTEKEPSSTQGGRNRNRHPQPQQRPPVEVPGRAKNGHQFDQEAPQK